ncbi:MAG: hypothetical protein IJR98_00905 [Synergistaceae bacterium]|nr:hypothetical protein [Synergistaceae bacterium]
MSEYMCNLQAHTDRVIMSYYGCWEFCTEYKRGDVVWCEGSPYLCDIPHAGKDPKEAANRKYWLTFGYSEPPAKPDGRIILDGGFASTSMPDEYTQGFYGTDGGSSNGRVHIPLV